MRVFGCSETPDSYETTLDMAKAVADISPGALSNKTDAPTDPLGVFQHTHDDRARARRSGSTTCCRFGTGRAEARKNYRACPPADEALARTKAHYHEALGRAVVLTPNPQVNRGVLWAKANMLRVMVKAPTGWCFVNDPTRSNNSVGRDTAWFAYGGDYLNPEFVRESLLAYVHNQEKSGKVVEYYDIRNGKTADYDLNINDNTPLLILALWHHYNTTGDKDFLQEVYPGGGQGRPLYPVAAQRAGAGLVYGDRHVGLGHHRLAQRHRELPAVRARPRRSTPSATPPCRPSRTWRGCWTSTTRAPSSPREAEALKTAINTHLHEPRERPVLPEHRRGRLPAQRRHLRPGLPGHVRRRRRGDGGAHHQPPERRATSGPTAGMRTTPRDAPDYDRRPATGG